MRCSMMRAIKNSSRTGIGDDVEERLDQIMRYAAVSFLNTYDVDINYTILSFESSIGIPYSYANMLTPCDDLWDWEPSGSGIGGTIMAERVWNHTSGQCHCILKNSNCFVNLQTPGHHNSAYRVLAEMHNAATFSNQYDAVIAFVGYRTCYYNSSTQKHGYCGGMTKRSWNNCVVSGVHGSTDQSYCVNNPVFLHGSPNFSSTVRIFQHEFSHVFECLDGCCTSNYPCIMSGGFDGIVYANNIWCTDCSTNYFDSGKFD